MSETSDSNRKAAEIADTVVLKTALSQSVKHVTSAVTGSPLAGDVAGRAANNAYSFVPGEVKAGAVGGGLVTVVAGTHIISVGTAGSIAFGASVIAAAPVMIVGGALLGACCWIARKL